MTDALRVATIALVSLALALLIAMGGCKDRAQSYRERAEHRR